MLYEPHYCFQSLIETAWYDSQWFGGVIGGVLGIVGTIIGGYWLANCIELKRNKRQKIEELLSLIIDITVSLDRVIKVHQGYFKQIPSYDINRDLSFESDMINIQTKVIHTSALIDVYIEKIEPFGEAVLLLCGEDGYFDKRIKFFSPMIDVVMKGEKTKYTIEEKNEKEKLDNDLVGILKRSIKLFQDAHLELIQKLKKIS